MLLQDIGWLFRAKRMEKFMSMPSPLSKPVLIRLSGGVRVEVHGEVKTEFGTTRNRSLLALLAMRLGSLTRRETAIDLIWPDADLSTGRNRLSTALVFLRKLPGSEGQCGAILGNQTHLWLNTDVCSVDVLEIEGAFERANLADGPVQVLEQSFQLFQGALAPEIYDEWIVLDQVRFSEVVDSVAKHLVERQVAHGQVEAAKRTLYKYRKFGEPLEFDAWHHHVHGLDRAAIAS